MQADELTTRLRDVLVHIGYTPGDAQRFSSHSCRATLLSWAAKAGLPMEVRRLLAGHAKSDERSPLAYSRDALAGPLAALEKVLHAVRQGTFEPDCTRSGRWYCDAAAGGAEAVAARPMRKRTVGKLALADGSTPGGVRAARPDAV